MRGIYNLYGKKCIHNMNCTISFYWKKIIFQKPVQNQCKSKIKWAKILTEFKIFMLYVNYSTEHIK